jgi:hypothetical protein
MAGSRLFWLAEEVEEWLRTAPVPTWAAPVQEGARHE